MAGDRPFDDERWPDQEGFADCFMCGRKIDPLDPQRGTYTANARACEPLPAHLDCLFGANQMRVYVAFMTALNVMTDAQIKAFRRAARVAISPDAP